MSASSPGLSASLSTSGYEDGLGRRSLVFDRTSGVTVERLTLRPELIAFERVLERRAALLGAFEDERIARVRGVARDSSGRLTVDSEFVAGDRLCDLIDAAAAGREDATAAGVDAALGFLLEVLPALSAFHVASGGAHGAVGPGRTILTATGQVVLLDGLYGEALQRLQFTRSRLWTELGIAMPSAAGPPRFDVAADVTQAAVCAVMLVLGRPLRADEFPSGLPAAVAEIVEIAHIQGSSAFAGSLDRFLHRALQFEGRRPFVSADDAVHEVRQIAGAEMGADSCRAALAAFITEASGPSAAPVPPPVQQAQQVAHAAAPVVERPALPTMVVTTTPVREPVVAFDPAVLEQAKAPTAPAPQAVVEPHTVIGPSGEGEAVPEPAEPPAAPPAWSKRRKRDRGPRSKRDKLRSNAAPPAPLTKPGPAPLVDIAVPAPLPPPRPVPVPRMPFAAEAATLPAQTSPYMKATDRLWDAPSAPAPIAPIAFMPAPIARAPIAAAPIAAAPAAPAAPAPLRVKAQPPAGYAPPAVKQSVARDIPDDEPVRALPYVQRGGNEPRRPFPWSFVAAALVVMVVGVAAGRAYLPDSPLAKTAEQARNAVVAAAVPAAVPEKQSDPSKGTIVVGTQPAGARVLLDGEPAGETPVTLTNVKPGRHVLTLVAASGTVKRTVRVQAGKTLALDVPVFSGWVAVFAPFLLDVSENGKVVGTTEQGRLLLSPGRHELTFSNRELDYNTTQVVEIEAGEERRVKLEPKAHVNLNALPWAEVWIDGQRAGETPLARLPILLGTREIIFKHPQHGERRMTTTIKGSSPAAISVDFTKPTGS